jgi:hypothetical protein
MYSEWYNQVGGFFGCTLCDRSTEIDKKVDL